VFSFNWFLGLHCGRITRASRERSGGFACYLLLKEMCLILSPHSFAAAKEAEAVSSSRSDNNNESALVALRRP
jgi:hypothetical protein